MSVMLPDDSKFPIPPPADESSSEPLPLGYIVYAVVLVGSAVAVSEGAVIAAVIILVGWGFVFYSRSRPRALIIVCGLLFITCCLPLLLLPAVTHPRSAARRTQCKNNLKQIGIALHNYHDVYGSFPPATTYGPDDQPFHSWRVLLLPYFDHARLYEEYQLDEPWDSPSNEKLLDQMPAAYGCPPPHQSDVEPGVTSYVAVVGENTFWPDGAARSIRDVRDETADGTSNTILIVECDAAQTPWLKPEDLTLSDALEQLTIIDPQHANGHHDEDFFYTYHHGRHVLLGDGSAYFIPARRSKSWWRGALDIGDGRSVHDDDPEVEIDVAVNRTPKLGNWLRLGWFLLVALFPLPWVWWNPKSSLVRAGRDN